MWEVEGYGTLSFPKKEKYYSAMYPMCPIIKSSYFLMYAHVSEKRKNVSLSCVRPKRKGTLEVPSHAASQKLVNLLMHSKQRID